MQKSEEKCELEKMKITILPQGKATINSITQKYKILCKKGRFQTV